jgi:uncharacterized protein (DUF952 family)
MDPLFHIVSGVQWQAACDVGRYAPESLVTEGFVHCSFADQVAGVANALYRDATDLIVVELDVTQLEAPVVEEDLYNLNQKFPHVYGAIPTCAAVACHELRRMATGDFTFSA